MKTTNAMRKFFLVPAFVALPIVAAAATVEIADDDTNAAIAVAEVARRGDAVVGTLVNRGSDQVRDVRLLVDVAFLWKDELHPGEESPGRSIVSTVVGPIAPGARVAFELTPNPPFAERSDGRYADPKVRVMGYQSIGATH